MTAKLSDEEFAIRFNQIGASALAREIGINVRSVHARRQKLERQGHHVQNPFGNGGVLREHEHFPQRAEFEIDNGCMIVGSDFHIWPGEKSVSVRAFIELAKELRPKAVILNGDVLDFPQISRHPPIGWQKLPTVKDEMEAAQDVLHDIQRAIPRGAHRVWTLGNHDARFSTMIASRAPELARIDGVKLSDHFPNWRPAWAAWANRSVVVKHRFKGGIHATHNNTVWAGMTMVTGHLHSQKVTPFTDYNGTRWGVDTGCMADPYSRQFIDYCEDNPVNWREGFAVLTFVGGKLLPPELVTVWGKDQIVWRGKILRV